LQVYAVLVFKINHFLQPFNKKHMKTLHLTPEEYKVFRENALKQAEMFQHCYNPVTNKIEVIVNEVFNC
jgi:hypothetical protein